MSRQTHFFSRIGQCTAIVALLAASGCADGKFQMPKLGLGGGGGGASSATAPAAQSTSLVERDVEAPEVFQKSDKGLWDGRPSLGGVWVAHDGVSEPERVIIRNSDNGKFVIGALFRKEAAIPGPKFQVSSDAAKALGMLAGAPANLSVTALRREEAPAPAAQAQAAEGEAASGAAPQAVASSDLPASGASPAPAPAPTNTSSLAKPYVQLGIFSVKANADRLRSQMQGAGLAARVVENTSSGRKFYRVLLGPANTTAERAELLAKAKAQGFSDAYFTRN